MESVGLRAFVRTHHPSPSLPKAPPHPRITAFRASRGGAQRSRGGRLISEREAALEDHHDIPVSRRMLSDSPLTILDDIVRPVIPLPEEPPHVPYRLNSYSSRQLGQATKIDSTIEAVVTDLPHREYAMPDGVAQVRVSVPRSLETMTGPLKPTSGVVRSAAMGLHGETIAITPHLHTENFLHSEFAPLPDRYSNRADLIGHCVNAEKQRLEQLTAPRRDTEAYFFDAAHQRYRSSVRSQTTRIGGADYISNFQRRHDRGLKQALKTDQELDTDPIMGLRWCKNCGQASGTTCHLVTQLNHFRKGLDVLEALRRHRNSYLGRDPADMTLGPDDLPLPYES